MTIHLEAEYLVGLVGLAIGIGAGFALGAVRRATVPRWDRYATLPLLLGAGCAHLALIGAVEPLRQVLFGLYGIALIGVAIFAAIGWSVWRLGGTLFPLGSIAAYFYFAIPAHQADYVGLLIKLVELAAIAAVLLPVFKREGKRTQRIVA